MAGRNFSWWHLNNDVGYSPKSLAVHQYQDDGFGPFLGLEKVDIQLSSLSTECSAVVALPQITTPPALLALHRN